MNNSTNKTIKKPPNARMYKILFFENSRNFFKDLGNLHLF